MPSTRSPFTAIAGFIAIALTACGSASVASSHAAVGHSRTPTPAPTPKLPPPPPPLTAPVIVQIENSSDARPQSGLSAADVVYEYETEGGISRFSAIYFQPPGGQVQVGPVRSARLATIKVVQAYDGTLLYSGASAYVVQALENLRVRQYNETSSEGALYRINSRYAPHNLYSDGPRIAALQQRVAVHVGYQLWGRTPQTALPPGGVPAPKFEVPVSQSEVPSFSYDPAAHGYTRTEPGTGVMNDVSAGAPWQPRTVVVLQVPVTTGPEIEDVSGTYGLDFGIQGSGDGQLAVGGQLFAIKWTQLPGGPPQLTLANGAPAPVAPDQVLIELVGSGKTVTVG